MNSRGNALEKETRTKGFEENLCQTQSTVSIAIVFVFFLLQIHRSIINSPLSILSSNES
ncbi:unnamed protein product, partial [Brassica oleracea var. botrytis]